VKDHAADQLHVEMTLAEGATGGLAHGREGGHEKVVERRAVAVLLAEGVGAGPELRVAELLDLRLKRVDRLHARAVALYAPIVGRAEDLRGKRTERAKGEHQVNSSKSWTWRETRCVRKIEAQHRLLGFRGASGCHQTPRTGEPREHQSGRSAIRGQT